MKRDPNLLEIGLACTILGLPACVISIQMQSHPGPYPLVFNSPDTLEEVGIALMLLGACAWVGRVLRTLVKRKPIGGWGGITAAVICWTFAILPGLLFERNPAPSSSEVAGQFLNPLTGIYSSIACVCLALARKRE